MGANYYTHIWEGALHAIMQGLQTSFELKQTVGGQMPRDEFKAAGNRQRYSFTVTYNNGYAPSKAGSAVCRDLQEVLEAHRPFVEFAKDKTITFRLDTYFNFFIDCK